ncbi:metallophosphoesterase [Halanaerocella petrolearia]
MKLAIFSDAHGRSEKVKEALEGLSSIDYLLYAGDGAKDLLENDFLDKEKIVTVQGNRDFRTDYSKEEIIKVVDKKIFMTHGHNYQIKWGLDKLYYKAKEVAADIVIFGHTHTRYAKEENGILFFNPGSIALPRDGDKGSYGLIDIKDGKINYQHYQLDK